MSLPALVIGAGPAGLMAAEMLARAGHAPLVVDAMPSPARKFLMAGKSGLNLTRDEPLDLYASRFSLGSDDPAHLAQADAIWRSFGPREVMGWAQGLGVELFTGSTGRVFPTGMKASPLLRAWLARLEGLGVTRQSRWRWRGWAQGAYLFDTPEGEARIAARVCVLALGGASWPRLGAQGEWAATMAKSGVEMASFRPANMGLRVAWSSHMAPFLGRPVKGSALHVGAQISRGEWVISRAGMEGGGIYPLSPALREGAALRLDLAPDLDAAALASRFARPRGKLSLGNWLRRVLGDPVKVALLLEWGGPPANDAATWAARVKSLPVPHDGPMGLDRAISVAGGVRWAALSPELELRAVPNCFVAGEMIDWEAPTGGYLISGCLALGRHAGQAAARRLTAGASGAGA